MTPTAYVVFSCILICLQMSLTLCDVYTTQRVGALNTKEFKLYFLKGTTPISPVHDIPFEAGSEGKDKYFNMVVEIPRWSHAKMEMNMKAELNPITQDLNKGDNSLRYVANVFPYHGYIWNYGAIPQTWEMPEADHITGTKGDNDPLDVIEVGEKTFDIGSVIEVKVLGALALIDGDETDWKVFVIEKSNPKAKLVNNLDQLKEQFPSLIENTLKWFKLYKFPGTQKRNVFHSNDKLYTIEETLTIFNKMHENWTKLINKKVDINSRNCMHSIKHASETNENCVMKADKASELLKKEKEAYPEKPAVDVKTVFKEVDQVHYVPEK